MENIAELILYFAGLIPVAVSSFNVEKHYVDYYVSLWNFYGTILVILSYIIRESVSVGTILIGTTFIIGLLCLFGINEKNYNRTNKNLKFMRKIGASNIQLSIMNGFTILFFTENLLPAILIPFTCFFILVATRYFSETINNIEEFFKRNPLLYNYPDIKFSFLLSLGPIKDYLDRLRSKLNNSTLSLVSPFLISIIISIIFITNPPIINCKAFFMILAIIAFYSIFPLYIFYQNRKTLKIFIQISS